MALARWRKRFTRVGRIVRRRRPADGDVSWRLRATQRNNNDSVRRELTRMGGR